MAAFSLTDAAHRSIKSVTMTDVVADAVNRGYENVVDFFTRNEGNWFFCFVSCFVSNAFERRIKEKA